ncbi:MAG TPA: hypothetical protein V6D17_18150, partial [Candidatus Obscuribacterales bacterium]
MPSESGKVSLLRVSPRTTGGDAPWKTEYLRRKLAGGRRFSELMSLNEARISFRQAYALKPDQRFIRALAQIHQFITGHTTEAVETTYAGNNRWRIKYRGQLVGDIGEFASFHDLYALLIDWARRVASGNDFHLGKELKEHDAALPDEAQSGRGKDEQNNLQAAFKECSPEALLHLLAKADEAWQAGDHS